MGDYADWLDRVQKAWALLCGSPLDAALSTLHYKIKDEERPSDMTVRVASNAATMVLQEHLLGDEVLSILAPNRNVPQEIRNSFKMQLNGLVPMGPIKLAGIETCAPIRLAIAASFGAVIGISVFTPWAHYLLGMRDVGLLAGAVIGAFVLTLAAGAAAESSTIRSILKVVLGAAAATELVAAIAERLPAMKTIRTISGGEPRRWKRIMLYAAAFMCIVVLGKPRIRYSKEGYDTQAREHMKCWLMGAVVTLAFLIALRTEEAREANDQDRALAKLAGKIQALHGLPSASLASAVEELHAEMRNLGFTATAAKELLWSDDLRRQYETFGFIEPGDLVHVEQDAVLKGTQVITKGLVRKKRGQNRG